MKIIILGAGQVGSSLARHLTVERNDVTVIDINNDVLKLLQESCDIRVVVGHASHPDVLKEAGAEDADMLVAVTGNDETNMVACQVAYTLFRTPRKIARIRTPEFNSYPELYANQAMPVDVAINPEQLVTENIRQLIQHPGSLQVLNFASGKVKLVAVKAFYGGPLIGRPLSDLKEHMPNITTKVVAIYRNREVIQPTPDTVIMPDDEVFFIATPNNIDKVMSELRHLDRPYHRIIIAGGGNIGSSLARALEDQFYVKIIDHNQERTRMLTSVLNKAIILRGDASDRELLLSEHIEETDVFCAVTNRDEANIMSSILAKRLGANRVITLISKPEYVDLIQEGEIDVAFSPQQTTLSRLLAYVRRGDVATVHSLHRGAAEAIEVVAHGTMDTSEVIGRKLSQINLPNGTVIGAIVRQDKVIIDEEDLVIEPEDHLIMFVSEKASISKVERLFQVGVHFI